MGIGVGDVPTLPSRTAPAPPPSEERCGGRRGVECVGQDEEQNVWGR